MNGYEIKWALLVLGSCILGCVQVQAYSQVAVSGAGSEQDQGPRIFKALNTDLIFPKTFNSSDKVISTTEAPTTSSLPPIPYNHRMPQETGNLNEKEPESSPQVFVTPTSVDTLPGSQVDKNDKQEEPDPPLIEAASTGRAVDYRTGYPFGQLITPLMKSGRPQQFGSRPTQIRPYGKGGSSSSYNRASRPTYNKVGKFSDRFTPGEATAAGQFKGHHHHHHDHSHDSKVTAGSNAVPSYAANSDTYSFPPLNTRYPSPSQDPKAALPSDTVTSYLPPASGGLSNVGYNYPGPSIAPSGGYKYPGPLANVNGDKDTAASSASGTPPDDDPGSDDVIGVLPASAQDNVKDQDAGKDAGGNGAGGDSGMGMAGGGDDMGMGGGGDDGDMGSPAGNGGDGGGDTGGGDVGGGDDGPLPALHNDGSSHGDDDHKYDPNMEYPTPPPGWLESHPESAAPKPEHSHDEDHYPDHHDHHSDPHDHHFHDHHHFDYPYSSYSDDVYPEVIYDDHHPHHHIHHPPPPPPTLPPPPPPPPTEPPPPPPPPPEPRVKKYSYFYIGRKLWYIPLYFTVWFSFYILWLIIKSIGRHKVNLPNHYVSRRSLSPPEYYQQSRDEYINNLTVKVLEQIDSFKEKYLN